MMQSDTQFIIGIIILAVITVLISFFALKFFDKNPDIKESFFKPLVKNFTGGDYDFEKKSEKPLKLKDIILVILTLFGGLMILAYFVIHVFGSI